METLVELQEPFKYSIILPILLILIFSSVIIFKIYKNFNRKLNKENITKQMKKVDLNSLKIKYINEIDNLVNKVHQKQINTRSAYLQLSSIIRYFVYETTNIKCQNYTLTEIKDLNIDNLYKLIQEYYIPEFSYDKIGDILKSIEKTRKVIELWN